MSMEMCCFSEAESFRSYIDNLYSNDDNECFEATNKIKNLIIGSNKQKKYIIEQNVVPHILKMIQDERKPLFLRLNLLIIINSLAKGTEVEVRNLDKYGTEEILLNLALQPSSDPKMIEICLSVLKTIMQHPNTVRTSFFQYSEDINTLSRLIQLASADTTINCQSFVANILLSFSSQGNILSSSLNLTQAGGIPFLIRLINQTDYEELQLPGLKCLASMCFTNRAVSDIVCATNYFGKPILDVLTLLVSRSNSPGIQLNAAKCLTYIHRSGSSSLKAEDYKIVYKALPCLVRLTAAEFDEVIRSEAAESLAYLAEIDSELQRLAAISNHLISNLANLLNSNNFSAKESALKCFASLTANDETIRKRIIDMRGLIDEVLNALKEDRTVKVAAVRCLHSLSRSVQLLRTTFQDHKIWKPLMNLIHDKPSSELMTVVSSTICNLLLEFSPCKESLLDSGAIGILSELTKSENSSLRLNAIWALMNMAFQAEQHVKTEIINTLGTDRIFQLLGDSDTRVIMKTLGLLRNLLSSTLHIESIMASHSPEILASIMMVLESNHSSEIKEQTLCIVGNLAAGAHDLILNDDKILFKLKDFLVMNDQKLQSGALFAVKNLMNRSSRHDKLKEVGIIMKLNEILEENNTDIQFDE
ncbi:hypothetical protein PVAND_009607 [Polypedilum vanderplanki]|uniref:Armadillo repeat-containing protein 8 n=1 Tax=Polypedilum vanderplanki TaxID=319348 RepID=A0A9J6CE33_POLVA|nr:hypothetical protein PVAND_009607 [Polypedilum vanderplanki]